MSMKEMVKQIKKYNEECNKYKDFIANYDSSQSDYLIYIYYCNDYTNEEKMLEIEEYTISLIEKMLIEDKKLNEELAEKLAEEFTNEFIYNAFDKTKLADNFIRDFVNEQLENMKGVN